MDPFLSTFRDIVLDFIGLQKENEDLRKRLELAEQQGRAMRERIEALNEYSNVYFVTGPGGSPIYVSGKVPRNGSVVDLEVTYRENKSVSSIDGLFDAELHFGNYCYRISQATRIKCSNIRRSTDNSVNDLIALDIVFDHEEDEFILVSMFEIPRNETWRWRDLEIENPAEHPERLDDLRDCEVKRTALGAFTFPWVILQE